MKWSSSLLNVAPHCEPPPRHYPGPWITRNHQAEPVSRHAVSAWHPDGSRRSLFVWPRRYKQYPSTHLPKVETEAVSSCHSPAVFTSPEEVADSLLPHPGLVDKQTSSWASKNDTVIRQEKRTDADTTDDRRRSRSLPRRPRHPGYRFRVGSYILLNQQATKQLNN